MLCVCVYDGVSRVQKFPDEVRFVSVVLSGQRAAHPERMEPEPLEVIFVKASPTKEINENQLTFALR